MSYDVELDACPGSDQSEESLVVRYANKTTDRFRLHEYARVYGVPGLYEEVVQRRLQCESPRKLAELLVRCAAGAGLTPSDLAVFDLAAGNGVVGEELHARGVRTIIGSDNISAARDAARRDRPGLYAEYLVGDTDDLPHLENVIKDQGLNGLVAAGALGLGHVSADSFHRLWSAFPERAVFAISLLETLAKPGASDFGDYIDEFERRPDWGEIVVRERYRHRLSMAGDPIFYVAVAVRKSPLQTA